jgi:hypothetical protein
MSPVPDRDLIDAIGDLLREYVRLQTEALEKALREYGEVQFDVLREMLVKQHRVQGDLVDRLLGRMEALFRAPGEPPDAGQQRLDS